MIQCTPLVLNKASMKLKNNALKITNLKTIFKIKLFTSYFFHNRWVLNGASWMSHSALSRVSYYQLPTENVQFGSLNFQLHQW